MFCTQTLSEVLLGLQAVQVQPSHRLLLLVEEIVLFEYFSTLITSIISISIFLNALRSLPPFHKQVFIFDHQELLFSIVAQPYVFVRRNSFQENL